MHHLQKRQWSRVGKKGRRRKGRRRRGKKERGEEREGKKKDEKTKVQMLKIVRFRLFLSLGRDFIFVVGQGSLCIPA